MAIPIQVSGMKVVPNWYKELDSSSYEGIIELPLEQQQDLYVHISQCIIKSVSVLGHESSHTSFDQGFWWWKNRRECVGWLRSLHETIQWNPFFESCLAIQQMLIFQILILEGFSFLQESGDYRWLVVYRKRIFLTDPNQGDVLYRDVVCRLLRDFGA